MALRAIALEPSSDAYTQAGINALRLGQTETAIDHYEDAVRLGPHNYRALNSLGNASLATGDYDRAEQELRRALSIWTRVYGPKHPAVALAISNLGRVFARQGHAAQAREHLRRAPKRVPLPRRRRGGSRMARDDHPPGFCYTNPDLRGPGALEAVSPGDTVTIVVRRTGHDRGLSVQNSVRYGLGVTPGRSWALRSKSEQEEHMTRNYSTRFG